MTNGFSSLNDKLRGLKSSNFGSAPTLEGGQFKHPPLDSSFKDKNNIENEITLTQINSKWRCSKFE